MKSRIFFATYAAADVGLILYGILVLIQPDILLKPFFEHVYQFPAEANNAITYLSGLYRLLGYFNILPGVLGSLILYRYWITRGSWYLQMVFAATSLSYLGPVVFDNTVGTIGFFEILEHVLFGLVLITGLMMIIGARQNTVTSLAASSGEAGLG
jgi:hypothetical protein